MPNRPRGYADLHKFDEDSRIKLICRQARAGDKVGVIVDNQPEKIDRYIAKIKATLPAAIIERIGPGPTAGAYSIRVHLPRET